MISKILLVCLLVGLAAAQGVINEKLRWRISGVRRIPYSIASNYPQEYRYSITYSINRWNEVLGDCLPIQPKRASDRDFVNVINDEGCYSHLGKTGGRQPLSLDVDGCVYPGTVIHELLHAAGLSHTQTRPDRDNHITIHWGNIVESWKSEFIKDSPKTIGIYTPYDFYSVMHYTRSHSEWSINNRAGFTAKKAKVDYRRIGYGEDFSASDVLAIRKMYKCKPHKFQPTAVVNVNFNRYSNHTSEARKPILCSSL
ncbi:hypothetical protein BG004_007479 [Podila humilis]|nr:hypothetical protein BG004_007479 [Podila humilis]